MSMARLKGFNKEDVNRFFTLLGEAMDKYKYTPNNIYNVDETGITVVPSKMPEILAEKGKREIKATTSAERGSTVTCVLCMNASESFVPPMMIFPRKRDHPLLMRGAPFGSIHACHPTGWIQTYLFTQWFKHFLKYVKPSEASPVLLILDGHTSHTRNIELIDLARENHVQLLSLPPHSSHKIQPLDRTFMGPLKKYFSEEIRQFIRNKNQAATHYDIAELFGRAYVKTQRAELAINGFRVTGIWPLDKHIFQDHDFIEFDNDQSTPDQVHSIQQAQNTAQLPPVVPAHNCDDYDSDQTFCDDLEPEPVEGPQSINEKITNDENTLETISEHVDKPQCPINKTFGIDRSESVASITDPVVITTENKVQSLRSLTLAKISQERSLDEYLSPVHVVLESPVSDNILDTNIIDQIVGQNSIPSNDLTVPPYLSPHQLYPVPRIKIKSSNRGRKGTKSSFLTSSPYKVDLETSNKRKEEAELLKKRKNLGKELKSKESIRTKKRSRSERISQKIPKKKPDTKKKTTKKQTTKKVKNIRKTAKKQHNSGSSSEDGHFSVNDESDESPDRSQNDNAKCLYCDGCFSDDVNGELWVPCHSCHQWAHELCADVERGTFLCEFCK